MDTHVTFVLDSSGSMSSIRDDTIGGFNTFLTDQRAEPGDATVTLVDFDTTVDVVYQGVEIETASKLSEETYIPGGQTALYDALMTAIADTTQLLSRLSDRNHPENVVVVVLTDGHENASETAQEDVRSYVETKQSEEGWEFLFVGANQDAVLTAGQVGIAAENSLNMAHSGEGARAAHESVSEVVGEYRQTGTSDGFTPEHRDRQTDDTE